MLPYLNLLKKEKEWFAIHYLNGLKRVNKSALNLIQNIISIKAARIFANHYFDKFVPDILITFIDHHPINASLIETYRRKLKNNKIILVEEGISTYINVTSKYDNNKIFHKVKGKLKKILGYGNPEGKHVGQVCNPDVCIVSDVSLVRPGYGERALFIEWPKGPFPQNLTKEYCNIIGLKNAFNLDYKVSGILLGQPLSEDKLITWEKEKKIIQMIGEITKESKQPIMVKPHPRESKTKLNIYMDNGLICNWELTYVPIETIFSFYRPDYVISYFSSAAINYLFRFNGNVIWLEKLLFGKQEEANSLLNNCIGNKVWAPEDGTELRAAIMQLTNYKYNNGIEKIEHKENDLSSWKKTIDEAFFY
ncbi:glycosyltransferase family 52 [Zhaonella formicivorans]|uniref:glycosyltransferase family 52 n=1 Tax=Zhaonella formicivorans TaxID=2528593 RepID=UPI0010EC8FF8|nr:glycosyltransferase family 52 [Zhaonella formicivorans]